MKDLFSGEELVSNHIDVAVENTCGYEDRLEFVVLFLMKVKYSLYTEGPISLSQKFVILFFI